MAKQLISRLLAEFVGTFALVFAGCGAIVVNDELGGSITHVGIALVFGLIVMVMIYAVGNVSGAHFNPAVSIAFWATKKLENSLLAPYILAQLAAAFLAIFVLKLIFPDHPTLGAFYRDQSGYRHGVARAH